MCRLDFELQWRLHFRRLPALDPFVNPEARKSDVKNGKVRGKRGTLRGKQKASRGLAGSRILRALPLFWRSLLLQSCGNDKGAVWDMINSWYMCGYESGYATVSIFFNLFALSKCYSFCTALI